MSENISVRFSRKVIIVSFILSVFVMYIHAKNLAYYDFGDVRGTPIDVLNQIMSETLGRVAVPFFFLQSGYWLFRYDIFEKKSDTLNRKLKKKVISLGIPYLLWNTFGFLVFIILTHLPGMPFYINEGEIVRVTWKNIIEGIFLPKYYFPFWFMQDLIVLTAISPVLVVLLRKRYMSYVTIAVLLVLYMFDINTPLFKVSSLMFFVIGGVLSVYHREYWENSNNNHLETACYTVMFLVCAVIKWLEIPYLSVVALVPFPILFWKICDLLGQVNVFEHEPFWFCKQSFFIYSAHIFLVEGLSSILTKVSSQMAWVCFIYMVNPPIALAILYVVARILNQSFPKLYGLLCGNRV